MFVLEHIEPPERGGLAELSGQRHPIHPHRMGDVLDLMVPKVLELQPETVAHLFEDSVGDADATRSGQAFQTCGHVDPVAEQVVALNHHVAEVHADAKPHAAGLG